MGLGFANAIGELALVVFTTLAPAAAVGYALSCLALVFSDCEPLERNERLHKLFAPLSICMIGLIASAAHLGNPANVLYVLTGITRSPLSNEVTGAVVFLALAAMFWLYSFGLKPNVMLQRVWAGLICAAALVFITLVSIAYDVETIVTWHSFHTPLSIWCNAFAAGPLLAILTIKLGGPLNGETRFFKPMATICLAATAIGIIVYLLQGFSLYSMGNYILTAQELFPYYWAAFALHVVLGAAAVLTRRRIALSTTLMFTAIFVMRFSFYIFHMTAGLGI